MSSPDASRREPRSSADSAATAMAGLALHAATLNMLVSSGAFTQDQADQAFANALRYLRDAARDAPENADMFAIAEALVLSLIDDGGVAF